MGRKVVTYDSKSDLPLIMTAPFYIIISNFSFPFSIEGLATLVKERLSTSGPRVNPQLLLRCPMCENASCGEAKNWLRKVTNQ